MMGAMPAVAVRLERRKAEQRMKRPSQLYLGGYPHIRQQTGSPNRANSPSPSPLLSPPRFDEDHRLPEVYICGRVSALHLAVVSLLLGAVILIVGLVQLKPGADAPGHRYYLIAVGCFLEVLGLIITAARCVLLHAKLKKRRSSNVSSRKCDKIVEASSSSQVEDLQGEDKKVGGNQNIQVKDTLSPYGVNQRHLNLKQLYNSTDVMYIDELSEGGPEGKSKSPAKSVTTADTVVGETSQAVVHQMNESRSIASMTPTDPENLVIHPNTNNVT